MNTPIKDILKRVGENSQPAYAKEFEKKQYKIFIHKPVNEAAKIEKNKARQDDTI
jgi:hypothetical protein